MPNAGSARTAVVATVTFEKELPMLSMFKEKIIPFYWMRRVDLLNRVEMCCTGRVVIVCWREFRRELQTLFLQLNSCVIVDMSASAMILAT